MTPADLAPAADRELAAREKHWPAEVAAGRMTQAEADRDIAAWRAIAAILRDGRADFDPALLRPSVGEGGAANKNAWTAIWQAAATAVERRIEAAVAKPTPANEQRLAAVAAIRTALLRTCGQAGVFDREREALATAA